MAQLKHKLSEPPTPPERGVKAATFKLLLETAMNIIRESGHIPSVAEAAALAAAGPGSRLLVPRIAVADATCAVAAADPA